MKIHGLAKFMIWGLAVCFARNVIAQEADLLDTLLKNKAITKEQYEQLRQQKQMSEEQEARPQGDSDIIVTTKGGLQGRSRDGRFSFLLGGRLMVDGAVYSKDKQDMGNGSEIRRARLDVSGFVWNDWGYRLEVDFAENEVDIKVSMRAPMVIPGHLARDFSPRGLMIKTAVTKRSTKVMVSQLAGLTVPCQFPQN